MKCLHPIFVKCKDDSPSTPYYQRHGITGFTVPCGKCYACLRKKRNEWVYRLSLEHERAITSYFCTITYDDNNIPVTSDGLPTLNKEDIHSFMDKLYKRGQKRWQEKLRFDDGLSYKERKNKHLPIKYFAVGEYGGNYGRPHYHFALFNYPADNEITCKDIREIWNKQQTIPDIRYISGPLLNYLTKYMVKFIDIPDSEWLGVEKPFRCMSKGLGKSAVTKKSIRRFINSNSHYDKVGKATYSYPRYIRENFITAVTGKETDAYYEYKSSEYSKSAVSNNISIKTRLLRGEPLANLADIQSQINERLKHDK